MAFFSKQGPLPPDLSKLPAPRNGCYWFGPPGNLDFPSIQRIEAQKNPNRGKYMLYVSHEAGYLFDGPELRAYETPEQALVALRQSLEALELRRRALG